MNEREQDVQKFDAEHEGGDGFAVADGWILYSDGAMRSRLAIGGLGPELRQPPGDPKEVLRLQKTFWEAKLQAQVNEFAEIRAQAGQQFAAGLTLSPNRVEKLKILQTQIRRARSKLNCLTIEERGYTQADVGRAWDCWQEFTGACHEESCSRQKYESAVTHRSSPGVVERLKLAFEQARERSQKAADEWNSFSPAEARSVVAEELDQRGRQEKYNEMSAIEV